MKITNNLNLPEPIVEACKYDDYDAGDADISVSSLIGPSLIRTLKLKHGEESTVDVADMIFALTGKAVHEVLRRSALEGISEKRLFAEIGGKKLSGQFDHLSLQSDTLSDYKETSVWSVVYGNDSWEPQLNVYAWLLHKNGYKVPEKLQIVAFLRDHQKTKAKFDPKYPQFRVHLVPIKRWTIEQTEKFIMERLDVHFSQPPTCTDKDRWKTDDKWAVMKNKNVRAVRVLDSEIEAKNYLSSSAGTHIVKREGEYRRCSDYCEVNSFCPIYKGENNGS